MSAELGTLAEELVSADQSTISVSSSSAKRWPPSSKLAGKTDPKSRDLLSISDMLVKNPSGSWAATVGLRHRLRRSRPRHGFRPQCQYPVLDTEVYSNTGGQASKSTRAALWPSSP